MILKLIMKDFPLIRSIAVHNTPSVQFKTGSYTRPCIYGSLFPSAYSLYFPKNWRLHSSHNTGSDNYLQNRLRDMNMAGFPIAQFLEAIFKMYLGHEIRVSSGWLCCTVFFDLPDVRSKVNQMKILFRILISMEINCFPLSICLYTNTDYKYFYS